MDTASRLLAVSLCGRLVVVRCMLVSKTAEINQNTGNIAYTGEFINNILIFWVVSTSAPTIGQGWCPQGLASNSRTSRGQNSMVLALASNIPRRLESIPAIGVSGMRWSSSSSVKEIIRMSGGMKREMSDVIVKQEDKVVKWWWRRTN